MNVLSGTIGSGRLSRPILAGLAALTMMTGAGLALVNPVPAVAATGAEMVAWGYNAVGQATVPEALAGTTLRAISAGGYHSLALTSDGEVVAWGSNETSGGTFVGQATVPSSLTGMTVTAIAAGGFHNLALTSEGSLIAWGNNHFGQTTLPTSLDGKTVTAMVAGSWHNLVLAETTTLAGFYAPVAMNNLNTVKGGSTVPLKFEVFQGNSELTDAAVVKSFTQRLVSCDTGLQEDPVEITTTGGTRLRYDTEAGQFIQNWQTPKAPGSCYQVTVTTQGNSSLTALFRLK